MSTDPRIDTYIARAAEFARPILTHFRELVHQAAPTIEETVKWSMPFFVYEGRNVCHMAAFKAHCAIGFWHPEVQKQIERKHGVSETAMGAFGRIASVKDLPSDRELVGTIRAAVALAATGAPARPAASRQKRPEAKVPVDLAKQLKLDAKARATFEAFSPSHRREYIEWITEAKRPETRASRIETTVAWLREGKARHWKYER